MKPCPRCHDVGYIFGHWMPELCQVCGAEPLPPPPVVHTPAKGVDGFVIGALILGAVLTIGAMWGVIEFFAAVLV